MAENKIDLEDVAQSVFSRCDEIGFEKLSPEERVFACVWALDGEVNNGGFDQYFFNSSGDWAQDTPAALEVIGATKTVQLLRDAMAVFGEDGPPRDWNARTDIVDDFDDEVSELLDKLDNEYYANADVLEPLLERYVADHRGGFKV